MMTQTDAAHEKTNAVSGEPAADSSFAKKVCPRCKSLIDPDAPGGLCPTCLMEFVALSTSGADWPADERVPPDKDTLQAAFPTLEIIELIGQGGMGAVYKARQKKLNRMVALKILPQRLAREPAFAERFEREGRLLAHLNHPNIVGVYDFGESSGFYYLLMEYVDGVNLRQAYNSGTFTAAQALAVIPKICDALQFAHEEGVLHRDIKPENILLDAKGRTKIADFGIAKFAVSDQRTGLTATGATIGTPHYMAPEQIERPSEVDHRADIYSLGVVFYEMLTGELPLGRFAAPSQRSGVDARLDPVVLRALEKDRELRQQSAGQVRTEVESVYSPANTTSARHLPESSNVRANSASSSSHAMSSRSAMDPPIVADNLRLRWAYIGMCLVVLSVSIPLTILLNDNVSYFRNLSPETLVRSLAYLALWLGVPGTLIGWIYLRELRKQRSKSGLGPALTAACVWPALSLYTVLQAICILCLSRLFHGASESQYLFATAIIIITALVLTYFGIRNVRAWTLSSDTEILARPKPLLRMRRRMLIVAGCASWLVIGLVCLTDIEQANFANRIKPTEMPAAELTSLEIVSAKSKENVLLLEVKWTATPPSLPLRLEYYGPALTPSQANQATESYDGTVYFPGESVPPLAKGDGPDGSSTAILAFALPDAEFARACKYKIERAIALHMANHVESNAAFNKTLFQITNETLGVYYATLAPMPYSALPYGASPYGASPYSTVPPYSPAPSYPLALPSSVGPYARQAPPEATSTLAMQSQPSEQPSLVIFLSKEDVILRTEGSPDRRVAVDDLVKVLNEPAYNPPSDVMLKLTPGIDADLYKRVASIVQEWCATAMPTMMESETPSEPTPVMESETSLEPPSTENPER